MQLVISAMMQLVISAIIFDVDLLIADYIKGDKWNILYFIFTISTSIEIIQLNTL